MSERGRKRLATWAPLAAAALLFALLLQRSWLRWSDVLIDYGRELYVPWRITAGEVLYRDLAWFNGPLSPYLNAGLFATFGVSYRTLAFANLAFLLLFLVLLQRLLARLGSPPTAGIALAFLLPVVLLAHHVTGGNYDFVTPYSHDLVHGLMLGVAAFATALGVRPSTRARPLATGLLLGLVLLTKAEVALAALAGSACALWGSLASLRAPARGVAATAAWVLAGLLIPPAVAFALLCRSLPPAQALAGVLAPWSGILNARTSSLAFYRLGMGLDRPAHNLLLVLASTGIVLASLLPGLFLGLLGWPRGRAAIGLGALLAIATPAVWIALELHPGNLARPLPFFLLAGIAVQLVAWRRAREPERRRLLAARIAWYVFALVLLAKIVLFTRFQHYGFVLTLPAATCAVLFLTGELPAWVAARGGRAGLVLASSLGLLLAVAARSFQKSDRIWRQKTVAVGQGADRFLAGLRGAFVRTALRQVESRFASEDEILVLPEGVTINYLARRKTPTPYVNFMPPELLLFGQDAILEALRANPPEGIVVVHKDTSEYGYPLFGRDYGQEIWAWVAANYRGVWIDPRGQTPLLPGTIFGVMILERADRLAPEQRGR